MAPVRAEEATDASRWSPAVPPGSGGNVGGCAIPAGVPGGGNKCEVKVA